MLERIERDGIVTADDVAALRRTVFADGHVSDAELEEVCRVLDAAPEGPRDWRFFLDDVFGDYFLNQVRPQGYVTPEGAERLVRIGRMANRPNRLKTEVIVHLLSRCIHAPSILAECAYERVEADVLSDGRVTPEDVELLRKLVYSPGSDGGIRVARREAELLFTINEYSREDENCAAWLELFAKAVTCHVMVRHGYVPPSREEALRREDWLEDAHVNVGGFLSRMVPGLLTGAGRRDRGSIWTGHNRDFATGTRAVEEISHGEAAWLAGRIGKDGRFCNAERALIAYLDGLCEFDLPQVLAPFRAKAA